MGGYNLFKGLFSKNSNISEKDIRDIKSSQIWRQHKEEFPDAELIPIGAFNSEDEVALRQFLNKNYDEFKENKKIVLVGSTEGILIKKEEGEIPIKIVDSPNKKTTTIFNEQIEIEHDKFLNYDYKGFLADF